MPNGRRHVSFVAAAVLLAVQVCAAAPGAALVLHVATTGNDAWSGRLPQARAADGPFRTLEGARDEIRKLKQAGQLPPGGVTVELRSGVYELSRAFELTAEDAGTEAAPIVYRARAGEQVCLLGGKQVTNFKLATDPEVLARLDPSARGRVWQADLKALGITDFGEVAATGKRLEFFFQDQPMVIARWPNEGFVNIVDVVGGAPHRIHGLAGDKIGKFTYEGERPTRWLAEADPWLHGYWFWDWADERLKVDDIDPQRHTIALAPPYHSYGYRRGQRYYAFNLLSEIDRPGEWYLDRQAGMLYFLPPTGMARGQAIVSILPGLITMKDVAHVALRGMTLEAARGTAVTISGGTDNRVAGCVLRNLGGYGVTISGGTKHGVIGCDIYGTGEGGITLSGGDRPTLTPAGHYADNNHIHDYSRINRISRPAIGLYGVGNRASHNLIHDAPHIAIMFSGNDHVIEYNEIHSVLWEVNDAGAIYAGREWTMRGTVIRYNYIHHVYGPGLHKDPIIWGIYLDDMYCGTTIYGNVFYELTRGVRIAGGRDNTIENNVFVNCNPAVEVHSVGVWAMAASSIVSWTRALTQNPFHKRPPYSDRYPGLAKILEDEPELAKGNLIARNVWQGGKWANVETVEKNREGVWVVSPKPWEPGAQPPVVFEDNLVDQDPRFVDAPHGNFALRADSPAYKLGFKRLPLDKIGLYKSEFRATWPVTSKVRPKDAPAAAAAPATSRPASPRPVFEVRRRTAAISIDGHPTAAEWSGADPAQAMVLEQGVEGDRQTPRSLAWLCWDDRSLYVAVDNALNPNVPVRPGNQWGQDDAVEIAVRVANQTPILVLRGFPSGHFESSEEAGAPPAAAKQAAQGVTYAAQVPDSRHWTAEWRIPFISLGLDPAQPGRHPFNLTVRKTADDQWLEWTGTGACTWEVDRAGLIQFVP